ncbi:hypothetical protein TH53_12300 [Pedobacter lusitanus]|uniref:Uncharacterized protein n=1 Tax=Pedobacter lusitanus TaxID=1503925 RepID=A0A0D0GI17_9SPHI|nr:hypothetical protein [Pedobacter lusitanus]KIO76877.1 hypothetical protein TH53_12300 [Pedobacter lusitanus]
MKTLMIFCGIHSLFFAVFHCLFWKKLNWNTELKQLAPYNRAVMQILNLRLIYIFFIHSLMCLYFSSELLLTPIGNFILVASSLFWIGRTIEQFLFKKLLPFNVPINIFLTALFIIGSVIYLIPLII